MNRTAWLVSFALNGVLIGLIAWGLNRGPITRKVDATPAAAAASGAKITAAAQIQNTTGFAWTQLNPDNLTALVVNLRAIHCPETTIRDIIVARVSRQFAARRAPAHNQDWYFPIPRGYEREPMRHPLFEPEAARRDFITRQLGPDWDNDYRYVPDADRLLLNFLTPDRALAVWKAARRMPWSKAATQPPPALQALLNANELSEIALRAGDGGQMINTLREGYDYSVEDLRQLAQLNNSYGVGQEFTDRETQAFGAQRVDDMRWSRNQNWLAIWMAAHVNNIPVAGIDHARQNLRDAQDAYKTILQNNRDDPEARGDLLVALVKSLDQEMQQSLGAETASASRFLIGDWLPAFVSPQSTK